MTATSSPGPRLLSEQRSAGLALNTRLVGNTNRWFYPIWVVTLVATMGGTAAAFDQFIQVDGAGRSVAQGMAADPTLRAILGPPYDLFHPGSFTMWRVGTFVGVLLSVMAVLGVVRTTRDPEEDGRTELIRAGAVGRHSTLLASLGTAWLACLGCGLLSGFVLYLAQPELLGALTAGAGLALTGAVFAGVGAVAAQLHDSGRAARQTALGVLGLSYLVRTLADGVPPDTVVQALQWASPSEWVALARPYADERIWVLALPAATASALAVLAVTLEARRDYGAGLRAGRPGPARAGAALSSAAGLVRRLERGTLIGWGVGILAFAVVSGFLSGQMESLVSQDRALSDRFRAMGAGAQDLQDAFLIAMLGIVVALLALLSLQLLGRAHAEESQGRTDILLATATSRSSYFLGFVGPALLFPTVFLVLFGAVLAVPGAVRHGDLAAVGQAAGAAAVLAPGLWLVVGLGATVYGGARRLVVLPWLVVGWTLFVNWVGVLLELPQVLLEATPFAALPALPSEAMSWTPVIVESLLALLLVTAGAMAFRRRDIAT